MFVTVTDSENVTCIGMTSPALNVPFEVDDVTVETVGAVASIVTDIDDDVVETPLSVETAVIE